MSCHQPHGRAAKYAKTMRTARTPVPIFCFWLTGSDKPSEHSSRRSPTLASSMNKVGSTIELALGQGTLDDAAEFANVHVLSVGTPQAHGSYAADLTYVKSVITELVPRRRSRGPEGCQR